MMLSPLAHPFHPTNSMETFQIFNNGIPSLMPLDSDVIRGFSDEAIDECFPPTAQDVAELEAVEEFLQTLVRLELMEEREERVRLDITLLPKRWAVRRELQGKPRPARSEKEVNSHYSHEDEIKLVVFDRKQRDFNNERMEHHHSHKDIVVSKHQLARSNKLNRKRPSRPIIQPRKGF
mmetsp:Transcript_19199/g.31884  ORF Transcript_19199/g.31884 Transcript_19199/m.31884 type:complete len:178 (+) Transcript_19199:190-723(+)|eukprot:CAMPEP_0119007428 /NCGR_PEP_ID=MMETSP1176-20130426/2999_1 /TAXON_ID=265551 /ORGANISM="Synedropsis recta cf, Strain CCMP1620" /LENGTH=177 /DNA_ID=CAMNT_0006959573 /DNA_START=194 /DNA_END=727 /DNA_ORIENTATION=+